MEFIGYDRPVTVRIKNKQKTEFGDFQTPIELARKVCSLLCQRGLKPLSILEPSCGKGNFLRACLEFFPHVQNIFGIDINKKYVDMASSTISNLLPHTISLNVMHEDFFHVDWETVLKSLPEPLLVIGNPPWVTNAELGGLGSLNLPDKSNYHNRRGIDAITGKSNFDISEWLLNHALEWIKGKRAALAMLCKTSVARKVLYHAWKSGQSIERSDIYHIDASRYFGAAVGACLLIISISRSESNFDCLVHNNLKDSAPALVFGYRQGRLVASIANFERWKHLQGEERYKWRSGIKHDCARVMEFRKEGQKYRNGLGELVDLEDSYVFPMFKSSDIGNADDISPSRWMLVPQQVIGENTLQISKIAPKTWEYLQRHAQFLDQRASSVYRNRPRFSVFGVGNYSFAPWKAAISGFYKKLDFKLVGPYAGKPVVLDDTCYFAACRNREEALFITQLLNSEIAGDFFSAFVFWDEKRPVTLDILKRLDLLLLAKELNVEETMSNFLVQYPKRYNQPLLFSENAVSS